MNALYSLYDALISINVPADRARAVVDAMEHEMAAILATKDDVALLRQETRSEFAQLRQEMSSQFALLAKDIRMLDEKIEHKVALLRSSMMVWLGSIQVVGLGLLFAALKLT